MLFGRLADDYVRQPCRKGRGNNEGNGTELHAGQAVYSPGNLRRQGVGHVTQELRFGREEVLIHIEAAALSAGEHKVPFQERRVPDTGCEIRHQAHR
jgi:hypothetical protein